MITKPALMIYQHTRYLHLKTTFTSLKPGSQSFTSSLMWDSFASNSLTQKLKKKFSYMVSDQKDGFSFVNFFNCKHLCIQVCVMIYQVLITPVRQILKLARNLRETVSSLQLKNDPFNLGVVNSTTSYLKSKDPKSKEFDRE